eukprot:386600-Ditylum_brightwellii.AAC.1
MMIRVALAVRASGWVAFALSEIGAVEGSDVIYYSTSSGRLIDAHIQASDTGGNSTLETDQCQDWTLIRSFHGNNDFLIVEAERLLDTNDPQDRIIVDDSDRIIPPHNIIITWSNNEEFVSFDEDEVYAQSTIRFFSPKSSNHNTAVDEEQFVYDIM